MTNEALTRLYPAPMVSAALNGLYLRDNLRRHARADRPFIYTNFIASLDGRVAVRRLGKSTPHIPPALSNPRDWRLYLELSAQADAVVVSAGHARAMAKDSSVLPFPFLDPADVSDLKQWRLSQGLPEAPAVAVVTASMDLPFEQLRATLPGGLVCLSGADITPKDVAAAEAQGAEVLRAGTGKHVTGRGLARALARKNYRTVYSVAGAGVMKTLLHDRVLDRLYLTQVDRLIGGTSFDTLVESPDLSPPVDLALDALYFDTGDSQSYAQTFATYDVVD